MQNKLKRLIKRKSKIETEIDKEFKLFFKIGKECLCKAPSGSVVYVEILEHSEYVPRVKVRNLNSDVEYWREQQHLTCIKNNYK